MVWSVWRHTAAPFRGGQGLATSAEHYDAFIYGAGDEKLGKTAGLDEGEIDRIVEDYGEELESYRAWRRERDMPATDKDMAFVFKGQELREKFLAGLPAMDKLIEITKKRAKDPGYVKLPDRRRSYIRHEHAALNTLLQGAGSIICKAWIVEFNRRLTKRYGDPATQAMWQAGGGWDKAWAAVAWVHDEVQIAVNPEKADPDEVGQIIVESLRSITDLFNWRVQLDGEYDIGDSWAMTH